jgi:hypothetical protein
MINKEMIMIKMTSAISVLALLTACSALEQAPLVYTSKQVVGIDVSAPTTESSGITASVGFKNVDAAYVPVAVSKKNNEEGTKSFEIKDVYATYGRGDQVSENQNTDQMQAEKVNKLHLALQEQSSSEASLKTQMVKIEEIQKKINNLNHYKSLSEEQRPQFMSQIDKETFVQINEAINNEKKLNEDLEKENTNLTKAKALFEEAQKKTNDAKAQLAKSLFVNQRDAMSVFGSFESNSSGSLNSTQIGFGKMFSTGVAAQNLSKGIEKAALQANCYKLFSDISSTDQGKAKIKECIGILN